MKLLIIGSTGLVGENLINLLEKEDLHITKICFISSKKSRNKLIYFRNKYYLVKTINDINLTNYTHACILTSSEISKQITPSLLFNNLTVIDNSSAYRNIYNLTIPDINFKKNKRIYVNPNCCIIQSIIPLFYINNIHSITKITYNTYQSCSGGGQNLLEQLYNNQITQCIPFIGEISSDNLCDEEQKMICETNKLLGKNIIVNANCVRVPTQVGHLVNIVFETKNCSINEIYEILDNKTKYINNGILPDIINDSNIYTTRLKQLDNNTFSFYTYANNLLRGASYNTFLTLKYIYKNYK